MFTFRRTRTAAAGPGPVVAAPQRRVFHLSRRMAGLLIACLGAWGGIVAYVGPTFGYRMTSDPAWTWTNANWQLHAAPGAVCVLAGLLLMFAPRVSSVFAGLLAFAGGAWFVLGPLFGSMWLTHGAETRVASATLGAAARPLGFHYGTGLLICTLAGWVIGHVAGTRMVVGDYAPAAADLAPATPATPATTAPVTAGAATDGPLRVTSDPTTMGGRHRL